MKISLIVSVLLITTLSSPAQSITGLWGVSEVLVGQRVVTPVAKWFRYNHDSTFQAGNGWTQNSIGTWTYDKSTNYLLPKNTLGPPDPFGGFQVDVTFGNMVWKRMEEGDSVKVSLTRIDRLPMAPADSIQGVWTFKSTNDSTNLQRLHIRPDRLFNLTLLDGSRDLGFWHMDGHQSRLFLISFDKQTEDRVFMVSFKERELTMKSEQANTTLVFERE